jgi:threonine/homoserine/homoserine lactone efflux protein
VGELAAFLGVSALVIVLPGQDTVLTIRNTLLGGRRVGVYTALGVSSGLLLWAVAASAGLAALLASSEAAFAALKLAGAAYLVWLGLHALARALRDDDDALEMRPSAQLAPGTAYRQGLVSNLGNPKIGVFFTSLLPQLTPAGGASFAFLLGLGLLFCLMTLAWLTGYAAVAARAGDVLRRGRVRRVLDSLTGAVLVALGLRLAAEQR